MAKRSLTQLFVDRVGPPKSGRVDYFDTHLTGFGLRVSATGGKTWMAMYRVRKAGLLVRETLGSIHDIPNVADARARALQSIEKARAGVNPVAERKTAVERAKAETAGTFTAVADRFVAEFLGQKRPNTIANWTRIIEKDIKPDWGERPFRDITQDDALKLFNAKAKSRPKQADEVRKVLRRLCSWAVSERIITADADPTKDVAKRVPEREDRDRVLTDSELKLFWASCDRLGWPFGPAFKLLALTAQRREEVGGAGRREFDSATWTVPAVRSKNGKANIVHLSAQALAVLETVPDTGELLFASRGTKTPSGYSKAKARLDGYMAEIAAHPIEGWVLHDLRRTATTGMARLGIPPHVADRVLNHQSGTISGVAKIYNQFAYLEERQLALDAWGLFIDLVCQQSVPGNVAVARVKGWLREEAERREKAARGDAVPLRVSA
jgi:integrase